ncbi:MAG TPA: TonB-dependent receptor [Usitatibacter sp.]
MSRFAPFVGQLSLRTALLASALAQGIAHADTDLTQVPLEKLLEMRVIAASSYEQSAAEAPSAVSVITAEDIRNHGYRTLAEALASLPGLYVTDDLSYSHLGSRGFNRIGDYNSRFLLSVNGLRTNDALFDMAYLGTEFPVDMALIERIEFAPGPGSSIYGSNAMLGVINVVTRTGAELGGPRVAAAAGSNNLRELAVSFGKSYDSGLEVLASVSGLRGDGQDFYFPAFDAPATRSGVASGQNGEHYQRGYLRATYGGVDLEMFGGRRDKSTPSIYLATDFLRNDNRILNDFGFATLRYQREIAEGTRLEARVNTGSYGYAGLYPLLGGIDYRDDANGRWRGGELRVVSSYWDRHKLVAGVEVQDDTRLDQRNTVAGVVYLDRHDHGRRLAAYAQDEFRIRDGWLLDAGVRLDHYYTFGSSANPRVALIGELTPDTTLKLLYGSAFRAPNAFELYYQSSAFVSNAVLGPERSRSAEAVLEQRMGERGLWRVSLFHFGFDDLIEQVADNGGFVFRNEGSVRGRGVEVSATALLPAGARATASASFHDVRQSDGQRPTNSPRYTAKMALEAPLAGSGIRGAIEVIAIGPRLDRDRADVAASVLTNLVFTTREAWHGATFSLGVYNLFDRRNMEPLSAYYAPTQVPGQSRTLRFGAEWRY